MQTNEIQMKLQYLTLVLHHAKKKKNMNLIFFVELCFHWHAQILKCLFKCKIILWNETEN